VSIALKSGNLTLKETSGSIQTCTEIGFLFRIFYANFTTRFYISFVIYEIYKAVNFDVSLTVHLSITLANVSLTVHLSITLANVSLTVHLSITIANVSLTVHLSIT